MYAVLLAGGKGTRMGELTKETPKPLVQIEEKPIMQYTLDNLPDAITDVIIVVGYLGDQIKDYFGDEYDGKTIQYVEQGEQKGTDHALRTAQGLLQDEVRFLVVMGDDLYKPQDLNKLIRYPYALLAYYSFAAKNFGLVTVDDNDNFEAIVEKSPNHTEGLVNAAAYVLGKEYFDTPVVMLEDGEHALPHTLLTMYQNHPARVVHALDWQPVGNPDQLAEAAERIGEFR